MQKKTKEEPVKTLPNWAPSSPIWSEEHLKLLTSRKFHDEHSSITLNTILQNSETFNIPFPIDSNRCKTLKNVVSEEVLTRNANSVYPIVQENVLLLYASFILHKQQFGNSIEREVYEDMDILHFVDRLLTKRAVSFVGRRDKFTLLNGKKGHSVWETIGTPKEREPTVLKNCLSYEEVKLSAFLSVSSYTFFVNEGGRKNFGVYSNDRSTIQDEGIIIGLIGPRLIRENVMDYEEVIITEKQNSNKNGYGEVRPPTIHHLFAEFYKEDCLDYTAIMELRATLPSNVMRYAILNNGEMFDNFVYYKRLLFSLDTLFFEANNRAREKSVTAFVHVVGIGLGVWRRSENQDKLFMDTCARRIKQLGKHLPYVSDICFAYIKHNSCGQFRHGDTIPIAEHPLKGIKIHLSNRDPHEKLKAENKGKLLVVSYAWDGNALPGNEFWYGDLGGSGDSAAACSTQITELHNPFINPQVCAANLQVVTSTEVVSVKEYIQRHIKSTSSGSTSTKDSSTSSGTPATDVKIDSTGNVQSGFRVINRRGKKRDP